MKKTLLTLISVALLLASCTRDEVQDGNDATKAPIEKRNLPCLVKGAVHEGRLHIKVQPQMATAMESAAPAAAGEVALTGVAPMDAALKELGTYRLERIFRDGGKFEARHRKAGLHLWYKVVFDENIDVMTAANRLAEVEDVTFIEGSPIVELIGGNDMVVDTKQLLANAAGPSAAVEPLYNDPMLHNQWHYYNDGGISGFVAGADINLFPAWEIESGRPEVIVSVVDGGIDYNHPDLNQNMWVNEAELNGISGFDDDGNDYVDDIYGYNFVRNTGSLAAHSHGTHVAGTVAAVNNNGIGVSGVAGGDGSPESGVRLMSSQVFQTIGYGEQGAEDFGEAIVYGADNGAVISQNSWGYTQLRGLDEVTKEAIDYFIEYAGTDENGVQTGPMKGGIVIFAAGNNNNNGLWMPGAYEKCLSVVSMGPNFAKASYSNYGTWTDVTAPGGEYNFGTGNQGQVYSTLPGNQYGYNLGTSMACPHVSGIAALAVSKYGVDKPGFTSAQLWDILVGATHDIDTDNPDFIGQMGEGYIDTYKVLVKNPGGPAPLPVSDLEAVWTFEGVFLTWSVTSDSDSEKASRYDILWSDKDLTGVDFANPPAGVQKVITRVYDAAVGEKISGRLKGMVEGKTYYIAIAAADADGNRSTATYMSGQTEPNRPPMVLDMPESISLKSTENRAVPVQVLDIEGYEWTYSLTAGSALSVERQGDDILMLTFDCIKALSGSYTATLTLTDEQGLSSAVEIPYTIEPNNPPVPVGNIPEFVINGVPEKVAFNLSSLFNDADGDALTYEVSVSNQSIAKVSQTDEVITVTSQMFGTAELTVMAKDLRGASAKTTVKLVCRDNNRQFDLYPVPVKKDGVLNVRMGKDVEGDIEVALFSNTNGAKVFSQTVAISPTTSASVNIGSLQAGTYKVVVRYGSMELSKIITKL